MTQESTHHCRRCGTLTTVPVDAKQSATDRMMVCGLAVQLGQEREESRYLVCRACWDSIVDAVVRRDRA